MTQDNSTTPPAKPSATIVLIREGADDPEILMVRRRAGDAFGDSYTFPGGVVDADESAAHAFCQGKTAEHADIELNLTSGGLDYYSAAVRELFEETGVLLARDPRGVWAFSDDTNSETRLRELRGELNDGALPWAELLRTHDLCVACDALRYFSFWETPVRLPKRWATRFFLAEVPPGQDAEHDGNELTDSCWMTASDVLQSARDGDMQLIYPTYSTLKEIRNLNSTNDIVSWAKSHTQSGIDEVLPAIVDSGSGKTVVLPGDARYPEKGGR
jgi:8-oxo-dGTP pyrophosphatase MutT (NUDIX family)